MQSDFWGKRLMDLKFPRESFCIGSSSAEASDSRPYIWKPVADAGINVPYYGHVLADAGITFPYYGHGLADAGITVPYYGHVLRINAFPIAVPTRYSWINGGEIAHDSYLSIARGNASVPPMEMTKCFGINYYSFAIELGPDGKFIDHKAVAEYKGPKAIHIHMCDQAFNDTISSILDMDAITIGNSPSDEKFLHVYREGVKIYGAGFGPSVNDIRSPATPTSTTSSTLLHIHMCYSDSNIKAILNSIMEMGADVIIVEKSRSDENVPLPPVFLERLKYGAGIGPGVYYILSPIIPSTEEIADQINKNTKAKPAIKNKAAVVLEYIGAATVKCMIAAAVKYMGAAVVKAAAKLL